MTKMELLRILYENSDAKTTFGLREPHEEAYVPPKNLWQCIKQVFTGPIMVSRQGEIEIAVLTYGEPQPEQCRLVGRIQELVPFGTRVTLFWYWEPTRQ